METVLNAPRSVLDSADLVAAAEAMIPFLREKAPETNKLRRPSDTVRARLKAAGLARVWQPKRYGGADILRAVGRGCGSTAWILAQNVQHNLMLANWPEQAQDEIWGEMPDALVSGILIPGVGKAVKVDGGYTLSGRWPFVSGCQIADWIIFTGDCVDSEGKPEELHFVVPREQVQILDTWYTIGLQGSSSQDCTLDDVFVPKHMTVSMHDLKGHGRSPGSKVNRGVAIQGPALRHVRLLHWLRRAGNRRSSGGLLRRQRPQAGRHHVRQQRGQLHDATGEGC
ncbi:MAG: Flavin-dependent monooxygenase, oxygenase subunit HsaA [Paracidovorax wautersii]|uniref:Flavin-dependent monooxygenase, oxygenase subunit HsaA n=1 Tax=Paracidovorax wautersii TaxID=1177982 RepID=A0A7V8FMD2_9BURK|nr:MAG: Flavin-dependent monooxygenase, oxygenase subunit HsaA [Paracidovorax wautersii]